MPKLVSCLQIGNFSAGAPNFGTPQGFRDPVELETLVLRHELGYTRVRECQITSRLATKRCSHQVMPANRTALLGPTDSDGWADAAPA